MSKAKVAGKAPRIEQLEEGKTYAWCSCGNSENQPWCNGATKAVNLHLGFLKRKNLKLQLYACASKLKTLPIVMVLI